MSSANELIEFLKANGYKNKLKKVSDDEYLLDVNSVKITINTSTNKYEIKGLEIGHDRIVDLTKPENHCVVMLLIKLFEKGYSTSVITLEKQRPLGHNEKGSLDVMIKNPENGDIFMFEVKNSDEISKYIDLTQEKNTKQLFSYAFQEKETKVMSFYSYDFNTKRDNFYNVFTEDILKQSSNVDDLFDRWNKQFDKSDYITDNRLFNIKRSVKKYEDLEDITAKDIKNLFLQFETILRLYSISDKPNAFNKMINLFLCKIDDELKSNKVYYIKDKGNNKHSINGLRFQYIPETDTPESFMKRLNDLYKEGMRDYLKRDVIDYDDEEIEKYIKEGSENDVFKIIDNLRLKKNNNFAFIDIYDDKTFLENYEVVKSVVELLENYKFKYETKHQFLGDFFEELLNTSLKQEAGQFFTPYPLVDFMIESLPYSNYINKCLEEDKVDFIPHVIDYACGAGHFLISSMAKVQKLVHDLYKNINRFDPHSQLYNLIKGFEERPYSWVNGQNCVGIEKDYRLAKTSKIATFLNGDGKAEIICGDGINKFDCEDYAKTILSSEKNKTENFDFLISNPPYSIDGFMRNFSRNGITADKKVFTLLEQINYKDSAIETFFVERAEQLTKKDGYVSIILPQSILSGKKYRNMRKFIFNNFVIKGMLLTSDITFSATTTSPVILFMKKEQNENKNYKVMIITSPKYLNTIQKMKQKEVDFLGYEFSKNRSKLGIEIKEESKLKQLAPILNKFIVSGEANIPSDLIDYANFKYLDEILLNSNDNVGDIYPKYKKHDGEPLKTYCEINSRKENDFITPPSKYIEISDLKNLKGASKKKKTTRFCKSGDILIASICPKKTQIVISDGDYMVSSAIHVLSGFKNDNVRDFVFNELTTKDAIEQMNTMLDGFKVSYAKISEENLINNVMIKTYKENK